MKRLFLLGLFLAFLIPSVVFGKETDNSDIELKTYLSDMSKIFIGIEETIRNFSMKRLPANSALKEMTESIKKFQELKAPSLFLKDHNLMLSGLEFVRDGFKLLSDGKNEKSVPLVKKGAVALREAALNIKNIAKKRGLIPSRPIDNKPARPILPPQPTSLMPGAMPTPSPNIASPGKDSGVINNNAASSDQTVDLSDIKGRPDLPEVPSSNAVSLKDANVRMPMTAIGEVISVEHHDGYSTITLKDNLGTKVPINVNSKQCNVVRDKDIIDVNEIDEGNFCCVLYTESGGRKQATFIMIVNQEEASGSNIFMGPKPLKAR